MTFPAATAEKLFAELIEQKVQSKNSTRYDICFDVARKLAGKADDDQVANLAYSLEQFWNSMIAMAIDNETGDPMGDYMGRNE